MNNKVIVSTFSVALLALHVQGVWAAVTGVVVSPSFISVSDSASSKSVSIRWGVVNNATGAIVGSKKAVIRSPGGAVIKVITKSFSKKVNCPSSSLCKFSETVTIPVASAVASGYSGVRYTRIFNDSEGGGNKSATVNIRFVSSGGVSGSNGGSSGGGSGGDLVIDNGGGKDGRSGRTIPISGQRAQRASVRWVLNTSTSGPTCDKEVGCTVVSPGGTFTTPGGLPLGGVSRGVTGRFSGNTLSISERVPIPTSVIFAAQAAGVDEIFYTRIFSDGVTTVEGIKVFKITSGAAASFSLGRVGLQFEDGSVQEVADKGATIKALAEVTYAGRGLLEARWEVALPTSTAGRPVFRTLRLVRDYLSGPDQTDILSPALPTRMPGLYIVRLRISKPFIGKEMPELRYYITPTEQPAGPPKSMTVISPVTGATLALDTRFEWQRIKGAKTYHIEFFASPPGDQAPVSGMVVDGSKQSAQLSDVVGDYLKTGTVYMRVLAVDSKGSVIGESRPLSLRTGK
ncbi:MAG: hypothetical protein GXP09_05685 [Gammaproteobacteria bacterium]|nr:hypothetical protein [Gammaproteobacteria bacterium]